MASAVVSGILAVGTHQTSLAGRIMRSQKQWSPSFFRRKEEEREEKKGRERKKKTGPL